MAGARPIRESTTSRRPRRPGAVCSRCTARPWLEHRVKSHMSDNQEAASQALPPHAQLIQMGTGSWVSAVVYAAAKLGLADQLAAGPKSAADLAGAMTMHAP